MKKLLILFITMHLYACASLDNALLKSDNLINKSIIKYQKTKDIYILAMGLL